jgi:hypothetical protein
VFEARRTVAALGEVTTVLSHERIVFMNELTLSIQSRSFIVWFVCSHDDPFGAVFPRDVAVLDISLPT